MWKGCTVEGCDRKHYGKGLCALHYGRAKRGEALADPWTDRDEADYQSALAELAGIVERRVEAEMEAGECRAEAERGFHADFPLLASLLPPVLEEAAR